MKRLLSIVALLGLTGLSLNLFAQQSPSTQTPSTQSPATDSTQSPSQSPPSQTPATPDTSSMPQHDQTNANSPQSARSFEGKIQKSGDKLVLQDSASGTSYQLDDQDKAKQYEGKNVKVMGTVDSASNTLHIVDISPSESK
jgi:hypothetical protein